jgi:hypothetical protein
MSSIDQAFEVISGAIVGVDTIEILCPITMITTRSIWRKDGGQLNRVIRNSLRDPVN